MDRVRIGVTLKGKLARAFKAEASKTLAPDATLARMALVEYLRNRGHDVTEDDAEVEWGGHRRAASDDENEQGEVVAVAVR